MLWKNSKGGWGRGATLHRTGECGQEISLPTLGTGDRRGTARNRVQNPESMTEKGK